MIKTLLLNSNHAVISFISYKKAMKLLMKGKVDIVSEWEDFICWASGKLKHPAILRLKYYINRKYSRFPFSRKAVFKRDKNECQYCGKFLKPGQPTLDHILPKSLGGTSTFMNCITACYACNNKKGNKTPDAANMKLISNPTIPIGYIHHITENDMWHNDWTQYFASDMKI